MTFELDHLFICTDIGADAADYLVKFGLIEGTSNIHSGQGTSNRRFFFHNAMLELLWVHDSEEARSSPIRPTRLWDRWISRKHSVCPFGVCFRSAMSRDPAIPFSSWVYRPPYLSERMSIVIATNSDVLTEPMLFQISFGKRPDQYSAEKAQPLEHRVGLREITRVELISPVTNNLSPEFQSVINTNHINLRKGSEYYMELGFDRETQGRRVDFGSELPLILSW